MQGPEGMAAAGFYANYKTKPFPQCESEDTPTESAESDGGLTQQPHSTPIDELITTPVPVEAELPHLEVMSPKGFPGKYIISIGATALFRTETGEHFFYNTIDNTVKPAK